MYRQTDAHISGPYWPLNHLPLFDKAAVVVLGDRPRRNRLIAVINDLLGFSPREIGGLLV